MVEISSPSARLAPISDSTEMNFWSKPRSSIIHQASPGPGERIVVAPVDVTALRHERRVRRGHHMLAHLRTEAYPVYGQSYYPAGSHTKATDLSFEENRSIIEKVKNRLDEP